MYENASSSEQLFLSGARVTAENDEQSTTSRFWITMGSTSPPRLAPRSQSLTRPPHPISEFTGSRTATVVEGSYEGEHEYEEEPKREAEPEITFTFEGGLVIEMGELYGGVDTDAILLQGVTAVTETGEDAHISSLFTTMADLPSTCAKFSQA